MEEAVAAATMTNSTLYSSGFADDDEHRGQDSQGELSPNA